MTSHDITTSYRDSRDTVTYSTVMSPSRVLEFMTISVAKHSAESPAYRDVSGVTLSLHVRLRGECIGSHVASIVRSLPGIVVVLLQARRPAEAETGALVRSTASQCALRRRRACERLMSSLAPRSDTTRGARTLVVAFVFSGSFTSFVLGGSREGSDKGGFVCMAGSTY
ncbi:hypothetical protein HPB47_009111 [Ixodes persulcatus]|uniref:Uncharacterized protein n=1 Tax=Ixodes persulcatus TaxID=34615 RepID=A0AC60P320_IXOPE|nr:hypothetical protein HPB47_009111 [Ixodes persulcatus]